MSQNQIQSQGSGSGTVAQRVRAIALGQYDPDSEDFLTIDEPLSEPMSEQEKRLRFMEGRRRCLVKFGEELFPKGPIIKAILREAKAGSDEFCLKYETERFVGWRANHYSDEFLAPHEAAGLTFGTWLEENPELGHMDYMVRYSSQDISKILVFIDLKVMRSESKESMDQMVLPIPPTLTPTLTLSLSLIQHPTLGSTNQRVLGTMTDKTKPKPKIIESFAFWQKDW